MLIKMSMIIVMSHHSFCIKKVKEQRAGGRKTKKERETNDELRGVGSTNKNASSLCVSKKTSSSTRLTFSAACKVTYNQNKTILSRDEATLNQRHPRRQCARFLLLVKPHRGQAIFETQTSGYRPVSVLNSDSNLVSMPFVKSRWKRSTFLMDLSHDLSKLWRLHLINGSVVYSSGPDSPSVDYTRPWTLSEHDAGGISEPGCHWWRSATLSLLIHHTDVSTHVHTHSTVTAGNWEDIIDGKW